MRSQITATGTASAGASRVNQRQSRITRIWSYSQECSTLSKAVVRPPAVRYLECRRRGLPIGLTAF